MSTKLVAPKLSPFVVEGDYMVPLLNNVRTRPISWTSFVKAEYLTVQHANVLKELTSINNQEDPRVRGSVIAQDADLYSKVVIDTLDNLINLTLKVNEESDLVRILLTILYDGLTGDKTSAFSNQLFENYGFSVVSSLTKIFNKYAIELETEDNKINCTLASVLITICTTTWESKSGTQQTHDEVITSNTDFVQTHLLESDNYQSKFLGLQLLKEILSVKRFKLAYINSTNFRDRLVRLASVLKENSRIDLQMRYLTIYALWILTFEERPVREILTHPANAFLIPALFKVANDAVKEKIVRLAIAVLINIHASASSSTAAVQIIKRYLLADGLNIVKNLIERKWSDDDLRSDLDALYEACNDSIRSLTNLDEYENEVNSKILLWSPPHKNEDFWIDNVDKFKENNWKLVRELISLLTVTEYVDEKQIYINQAIVCYDLAMIIKRAPDVCKIITKAGAKSTIMSLMNSPDSNVKFEALRTTQLLVANSL